MSAPTLDQIQTYWDRHPAGLAEVSHLADDRRALFDERDRQTYALYPTLAADYDFPAAHGQPTLEVGCGMGYNAQCLAQHGAHLTVVDLAPHAVHLTRERFALRGLPAHFLIADAEHLPFKTGAFTRLYSSGVIHHSPSTVAAAAELTRVLAPGGRAAVMVYHRDSIYYWWNIRLILGTLMWLLNTLPPHLRRPLLQARPDWRDLVLPHGQQLTVVDVVRAGTDFGGLQNPLSRVYTRQQVRALFPGLRVTRFVAGFNRFGALNLPTPLTWVIEKTLTALDRIFGWFLIVHATKPPSETAP